MANDPRAEEIILPVLIAEAIKFVTERLVENKLVEVAFVVVELVPVRFVFQRVVIVDEALTTAPASWAKADELMRCRGARV